MRKTCAVMCVGLWAAAAWGAGVPRFANGTSLPAHPVVMGPAMLLRSSNRKLCGNGESGLQRVDWNNDGKLDILCGGVGTPRVWINTGTPDNPASALAVRLMAGGKPVRVEGHG